MNPDFGQISRGITDFKPPPSNNYVRDAKTFLESNGIVAKFRFHYACAYCVYNAASIRWQYTGCAIRTIA